MHPKFKVLLGQTVKDQITGFKGVVTGLGVYITGCQQVLVQPPLKKGDFVESRWFDEDRLEILKVDPVELKVTNAGPDKAAPRR